MISKWNVSSSFAVDSNHIPFKYELSDFMFVCMEHGGFYMLPFFISVMYNICISSNILATSETFLYFFSFIFLNLLFSLHSSFAFFDKTSTFPVYSCAFCKGDMMKTWHINRCSFHLPRIEYHCSLEKNEQKDAGKDIWKTIMLSFTFRNA